MGEIWRVPVASSRIKEAAVLGFRTVYLPSGNAGDAAAYPDLEIRPADRVADFLKDLLR